MHWNKRVKWASFGSKSLHNVLLCYLTGKIKILVLESEKESIYVSSFVLWTFSKSLLVLKIREWVIASGAYKVANFVEWAT